MDIFLITILILTLSWMVIGLIRVKLISNFNQRFIKDKSISICSFINICNFMFDCTNKFWIWDFEKYYKDNYKDILQK